MEHEPIIVPMHVSRMRSSGEHESGGADRDSWLTIHGDYLFAFAFKHTRNLELAEDLVQDTLLSALQGEAAFENRAAIRTWLVGILKHKLMDHYRRTAGRSMGGGSSLANWLDRQFNNRGKWVHPPARWRDTERLTDAERDELHAVLSDCLKELPPAASHALMLAEGANIPARQVGKILNASATNIGVILFRARTALRHCLEVHWLGQKVMRKRQ